MLRFVDQTGNEVLLEDVPRKIVSLVPSQTEYLFDLGLDREMVGVTKFCTHPGEKVKEVVKVGGTKNFHFDTICSLEPDLIIGNKEENYKEGIEMLASKFPVWMSDIANLTDALKMMYEVGEITGKTEKANQIIQKISEEFATIQVAKKKNALYLIWKKPYMTIGGDTFISQMMDYAGFNNLLKNKKRYPIVTEEEIEALQPEFILLSSEPYPFKAGHIAEFKKISSRSNIMIVDGEMFSWFGSRLLHAPLYFNELAAL